MSFSIIVSSLSFIIITTCLKGFVMHLHVSEQIPSGRQLAISDWVAILKAEA